MSYIKAIPEPLLYVCNLLQYHYSAGLVPLYAIAQNDLGFGSSHLRLALHSELTNTCFPSVFV